MRKTDHQFHHQEKGEGDKGDMFETFLGYVWIVKSVTTLSGQQKGYNEFISPIKYSEIVLMYTWNFWMCCYVCSCCLSTHRRETL